MTVCEFTSNQHPAEYILHDLEDENAIEHPSCLKHLQGMIEWRFANHAPGVCVSKADPEATRP